MKTPSVANQHKNLKCVLNSAVRSGLIDKNPYSVFQVNRGKSKEREFLTPNELTAFENVTADTPTEKIVKDMYLCAVYSGLRYSDIVKITPQNISIDKDKFYLSLTMQKTNRQLTIPLSELFNGKILPILGSHTKELDRPFFRMTNQECNRTLKTLCKKCGINKKITMHTARHTTAMYILNGGGRIELVSAILGHTNISTTQIYAKMQPKTISNELQKIFR